ncbi:hypothetical protein FRB93_005368 [Tulasnella sp. JGI-2019a]|nr:hypothetical protein FRB93_005368 [Tulasnella sp. JGI-2019a]
MPSESAEIVNASSRLIANDEPHNSISPSENQSEKLPIELLIKIFGYVSGLCGGYYTDVVFADRYVQKLHSMAQVCRRWLEVIKCAPELWTFVSDQDPTNAHIALDRSQSHPIGLAFRCLPFNRSLYNMVLKHSHRWRRFFDWKGSAAFVLDPFPDHPPRLISLTLVQVAMRRWKSPIFGSGLRSLDLACISNDGPTREDLRDIFQACPELAHLKLTYVTLSGDTSDLQLGPRVQLPLLHTLIIAPSSPNDIIDIARMAETPRCTTYTVSPSPEHSHLTVLPGIVMQVQQPFEACIKSGESLHIHLDGYWIRVRCCNGDSLSSDFHLQVAKFGFDDPVLDWINSILLVRRPPILPIPIDIDLDYSGHTDSPSSPTSLLQLSNVRSLKIADPHGHTNRLLEALSSPRDDSNDQWLWPGLVEVTVTTFTCPSTILLRMAEARAEAALRQDGAGNVGKIVKLGRFQAERGVFTETQFEAVRAVLGDVAVLWPVTEYE